MGSKSSIAEWVISKIPKAKHFYDLFGGGFSITHALIERRSKDFEVFHFNEIRPGICELIQDAIAGKYSYDVFKPKWISRDEFHAFKEKDADIKMCWSFGNNGKDYMFSQEIEPYKKSMHQAVVFNEFDDLAKKVFGFSEFKDGYLITQRRLFLRNKIEFYRTTTIPDFLFAFLSDSQKKQLLNSKGSHQLPQLQQLEMLMQLERLQQLNDSKKLKSQNSQIIFSQKSFEVVEIERDAIIYCDPPYQGTGEYDKNKNFNHEGFLNWAANHEIPTLISEYQISDSRFKLLAAKQKRSMLSSDKLHEALDKTEKLYANPAFVARF
jgi:site-specific DNA-adenine methylase